MASGYGTKARLVLLDGDQTLAEATLARGLEVARARGFDRLRSYIAAELMRIFTLAGDLERARELALARNRQVVFASEGFAVDASVMEANASRYHGKVHHPSRRVCRVASSSSFSPFSSILVLILYPHSE